jgi:hypothetical protein
MKFINEVLLILICYFDQFREYINYQSKAEQLFFPTILLNTIESLPLDPCQPTS